MWHRKKTAAEQLKCHPDTAKKFLQSMDDHLYQISLGKPEKIAALFLEQDPHTSGDGEEAYLLEARKERTDLHQTAFPVLALQIMEELLRGLTVFTVIQETAIPRLVVEELANYSVSPHLFSASYARFCNSHPTDKERVFFNGSNAIVTITNGINRALLETFYTTPGHDNTHSTLQCGVVEDAVDFNVSSYGEAERIGAEKCHIWMNYHCSRLHIGIRWSKEAERLLISKLQDFCRQQEVPLYIGWPYNE